MLTNLETKYDYNDVLIVPNDSNVPSRSRVKLEKHFSFKWSKKTKTGIGIVASNMDTVGTMAAAKTLSSMGAFAALHKHYSQEELAGFFKSPQHRDHTFYTMGTSVQEQKQLDEIMTMGYGPDMVCIDIANGYLNIILDAIKRVRAAHPDLIIMAGNVVTGDRAVKLIEAGADIVKVGIGPGSACTTRKQTGVGYPQLSAVYECAKAVDEIGGMVCADGGCTVPGDVAKAFIAGADFVMLGGMLAGTDESGGKILLHKKVPKKSVKVVEYSGRECYKFQQSIYSDLNSLPDNAWKIVPLDTPRMLFYGMSSDTAMERYSGGIASYRSSEGRTVLIPYKGKLEKVMLDVLGGLRSTCTYIGIDDIKNAPYAAKFVATRQQLNTVFIN